MADGPRRQCVDRAFDGVLHRLGERRLVFGIDQALVLGVAHVEAHRVVAMRLQVGQERHRVANCVLFVLRFRRVDEGLKAFMRRAVFKPLVGLGSEIVDDEAQQGQRRLVRRSVRSYTEILGAELRDAAFAQRPKKKSSQRSRRLGVLGLPQRRGMLG